MIPSFRVVVLTVLLLNTVCVVGQTRPVNIAYRLNIGDRHQFKLTTDQHIVGRTIVRVQSDLFLEVVDQDEAGNYLCNISIRSDTVARTGDSRPSLSNGRLMFGGYRLFSELGSYDALISTLGKVIVGQAVGLPDFQQGTLSAFSRATDLAESERPLAPYSLSFSIPTYNRDSIAVGDGPMFDTLHVRSVVQPITVSYGATSKIRGTSKPNIDTIYRTTRLDSIHVIGGSRVGFFTTIANRHTVLGERYTITTASERDLNSGLVQRIHEECVYQTSTASRLEYITDCTRISTRRYSPIDPSRNNTPVLDGD